MPDLSRALTERAVLWPTLLQTVTRWPKAIASPTTATLVLFKGIMLDRALIEVLLETVALSAFALLLCFAYPFVLRVAFVLCVIYGAVSFCRLGDVLGVALKEFRAEQQAVQQHRTAITTAVVDAPADDQEQYQDRTEDSATAL